MTTLGLIATIVSAVAAVVGLTLGGIKAMLSRAEKKGFDKSRIGSLEGKIDKLRCGEHIQSVNSMHIDMAELRGDLKAVMLTLGVSKSGSFNKFGFTANNSPLQLTDKGKEFVAEHSLDQMLYRNWAYIDNLIAGKELTTAYDIDKFCLDQALLNPEQFFSADDLVRIKDVAFSRGDKLEAYAGMVSVIVRNKYFADNDIAIADIEKNDPAKQKPE